MRKTEEMIIDTSFEKYFYLLWKSKYFIILITSLFAAASIFYSLQMVDKYKSSALILVVDPSKNSSNSSILARFGGLASMAGISVPSQSGGDKSALAQETIRSRDFFNTLIKDHNILPELYAAEKYNKNTNKISYSKAYNAEKESWNVSDKNLSLKPTNQQAYLVYRSILSLGFNDKSGYMSLSIIHVSPEFANKLIRMIVDQTNSIMRSNDLKESEIALNYLTDLISKGGAYKEIKESLSSLIETQLEIQMLVNVRQDNYLLKYIDQPYSPEDKFSPRRSLYVIMSTILGALLSVLFILFRDINKASKLE